MTESKKKQRVPSIRKATDAELICELNRRIQKTGVRFIIQLPAHDPEFKSSFNPDGTPLFQFNP
jgi:hypothetical protein